MPFHNIYSHPNKQPQALFLFEKSSGEASVHIFRGQLLLHWPIRGPDLGITDHFPLCVCLLAFQFKSLTVPWTHSTLIDKFRRKVWKLDKINEVWWRLNKKSIRAWQLSSSSQAIGKLDGRGINYILYSGRTLNEYRRSGSQHWDHS